MKRIFFIIVLLGSTCLTVMAQKELSVGPLFEGKMIPRKQMVETVVRGEQAKSFKLSLFHSLKMEVSAEQCSGIEELVIKDCGGLESPSVQEYGKKEGRLSYLIAQLADRGGERVYLCYQCYETTEKKLCITLVYMEGSATINDLYKMFKTDKNKKK